MALVLGWMATGIPSWLSHTYRTGTRYHQACSARDRDRYLQRRADQDRDIEARDLEARPVSSDSREWHPDPIAMQGNRRKNGSLIDSSHWVGLPLGSASLSCPASGRSPWPSLLWCGSKQWGEGPRHQNDPKSAAQRPRQARPRQPGARGHGRGPGPKAPPENREGAGRGGGGLTAASGRPSRNECPSSAHRGHPKRTPGGGTLGVDSIL